MGHRLERPALGQKVPLGTLYNARTDTFLDLCIFSHNPSGFGINKIHLQKSDTTKSHADTYQGRLELLETGNELGASLFCDLAEAGGAGRCLKERPQPSKPDALQHYAAVCHNVSTLEEKLLPNSKDLRRYLDPSVPIDNTEATHVLVSIVWGCKTVITVRATSQLPNDLTDDATQATTEDLHSHFGNAFLDFTKAIESLQYSEHPVLEIAQNNGTKFCINAYSEIFDGNGTAMENLQEALDLIRLMPALLQHGGVNDEKGEPALYCLLPMQMMATVLGLRGAEGDAFRANTNAIPPTPSDAIGDVLYEFDRLSTQHREILPFSELLASHRQYFEPKLISDILRASRDIRDCKASLWREYSQILSKLRLQGTGREILRTLMGKIAKNTEDCLQILAMGKELEAKIHFLRRAVADGAIYIGHNGIDASKVLKHTARSGHHTYVLHYGQNVMQEDPKGWNANIALMKELLCRKGTAPKTDVIIFLDYDARSQHLDRGRIEHYGPRGVLLAQDLLERKQFIASQSLARYNPKDLETGVEINKPVKRRMVKIPCPGIHCSHLVVCQWMCSECHSHIEFGYTDDFLYCECGRAKYDAWRFRCNSPNHDQGRAARRSGNAAKQQGNRTRVNDGFVLFKNKIQLLSTLHGLDQTDYVNILILGETGVGKSTFINSFVNYLAYETLDEAKSSEKLSWVVPCSFSIQTMDRSCPNGAIKERKVQVGGRDDENDGSTGASATQKTTVYPVNIGDKTIRLIDTPGIGDTRGLAYDKKNMADILQTLSSYEHLHGILILLKSNNSRLTVTFNFCMQELLTHLHRSASSNIAFGFTNTRISNYSPGDTFGPLTALLEKHRDIGLALENQNTYCFDSESFRYLAAFKNDIIMENEHDFRRSWEHSRNETVRLIDFFQSKIPHEVKSTLSMNGTRRLIAELTKPMADISQIISTNIKVLNDRHAELGDTQLSGDKLRQRLHIPKIHLRAIKLERPRTVCRNINCVEWRDDGTGTVKGVYKNPCHDPCYLKGVEVDRVNCPDLMNCWAFKNRNGFCRRSKCGHSWQEHLHVCYELEEYSAMVTDTEAQRLYDENASDIVVKKAALEESSARINVYRGEHSQIQRAAARFCIFLKKHSITPYNDATLEYLDMLIDEEKQKALVSRDKTKLEDLQASYASHVELVNALERGMADDENAAGSLDEAGVGALVDDLYNLPHFGSMLQNVKEDASAAFEATYRERPFKVPTSRRRGKAFRSGQVNKELMPGQASHDELQVGPQRKAGGGGTLIRDKAASIWRGLLGLK